MSGAETIDKTGGLYENELRALATCCLCEKKIGELPLPVFHKVTLERHGVDMAAASRQDGLARLLGGEALLANIMGPNEKMTARLSGPVTVMICDQCLLDGKLFPLFAAYEREDNPQ